MKASLLISVIAIIALFVLEYFNVLCDISDWILGITAIIVAFYTYETHEIRKLHHFEHELAIKPRLIHFLKNDSKSAFDFALVLHNLTNYTISAKVKCTFSFDGKTIEHQYCGFMGEKYWQIPYGPEAKIRETFNVLDILIQANYIKSADAVRFRGMPELKNVDILRQNNVDLRKYFIEGRLLKVKIEVNSENYLQQKDKSFSFYEFDMKQLAWIPNNLLDRPSWSSD